MRISTAVSWIISLFLFFLSHNTYATCQQVADQFNQTMNQLKTECPESPEQAPHLKGYENHQYGCQTLMKDTATRDCSENSPTETQCKVVISAIVGVKPIKGMSKAALKAKTAAEQARRCVFNSYNNCSAAVNDYKKNCMVWDEHVFRTSEGCSVKYHNALAQAHNSLSACTDPAELQALKARILKADQLSRAYMDFRQKENAANEQATKDSLALQKAYGSRVNLRLKDLDLQRNTASGIYDQVGFGDQY